MELRYVSKRIYFTLYNNSTFDEINYYPFFTQVHFTQSELLSVSFQLVYKILILNSIAVIVGLYKVADWTL